MGLSGIDHVNIDTSCIDATVDFYTSVLGMESRVKPSGNPGVWLYAGELPLVHVNPVEPNIGVEDPHAAATGRFNHVAFAATNVDAITSALDARGDNYRVQVRAARGVTQIFTTDPNGIAVELSVAHPTSS